VPPTLLRTGLVGKDLGSPEREERQRPLVLLLEGARKVVERCSSVLGRRGDVLLLFRDVLPFRPS